MKWTVALFLTFLATFGAESVLRGQAQSGASKPLLNANTAAEAQIAAVARLERYVVIE